MLNILMPVLCSALQHKTGSSFQNHTIPAALWRISEKTRVDIPIFHSLKTTAFLKKIPMYQPQYIFPFLQYLLSIANITFLIYDYIFHY